MKISVIVPFYNTEEFIKDCLESLYKQSFIDFEVLMINDGSIDNSVSIAKQYADKDNRFKLINSEHIGFPKAKNLGLDLALGDYICFVDSDDYVDERYLELLYQTAIRTNADISCCGIKTFANVISQRDDSQYSYCIFKPNKKMDYLLSSMATTFLWNKIYKKELFKNLRHNDVMALSDTLIIYKLFDRAQIISKVNLKLINHRIHNNNITYQVRHFVEGYWEYRLNVYIEVCSFICCNYPTSQKRTQNFFTSEMFNIFQHLTQEQIKDYLDKDEVQKLLDNELFQLYKKRRGYL